MVVSLPAPLRGLLQPAAYPHAVPGVQLVETHISWVFLTGEFAYKVKKPVCFPFVDLRSAERRAFFCAEELRLNRRFAPDLYLRVCPITLDGGCARLDGQGEVIDHAVCMRQFRAADELAALLAAHELAPEALAGFGGTLAGLHATLPRAGAEEAWGRPESVRGLLLRNLAESLEAAEKLDGGPVLRSLGDAYTARIDAAGLWIGKRHAAGRVRECHGDLHAGNIARYGGRLLAFDCIEFEPAFRWIDVAEEIACLYMDLRARGFAAHAQAFLNGYLSATGDYCACRLLHLYGAHRALVRAKVAALRAAGAGESRTRAGSLEELGRYVECARELLTAHRPRLILMCGVSGSGKSWLAERLAPALRAVHLRSDVERKRLAGLTPQQRSGSDLGEGLYSAAMGTATYERLRHCAAAALDGGVSVIIDATCGLRAQRKCLGSLGPGCAAAPQVIFCHAPHGTLAARVEARGREAADASEADQRVLALQEMRFEPIEAAEGLRVIDADTSRADVVSRVLKELGVTPAGNV